MKTKTETKSLRVHNISYSANNLLNVGIMYSPDSGDRNAFFIMVSLIPGATSNQSASGRTFVMSKAINMKITPEKLDAISGAIAALAQKKGQFFGEKFTVFTDPSKSSNVVSENSNKKSLHIAYPSQANNGNQNGLSTVITVKSGSESISIPIPALDAIGLSNSLKFLASKCRDLEYNRSEKRLFAKMKSLAN